MEDLLEEYPLGLCHPMVNHEPNETINIESGEFVLFDGHQDHVVTGNLYFSWLPIPAVRLEGMCFTGYKFKAGKTLQLVLFGKPIEFHLNNWQLPSGKLDGLTFAEVNRFQTSKFADAVNFAVPNLIEIRGKLVSFSKNSFSANRTIFETDQYVIMLDMRPDNKEIYSKLKNNRGYCLTFSGQLKAKSQQLSFEESQEVLNSFSVFLSLINGTSTSCMFRQGWSDGVLQWREYSRHPVEMYMKTTNWAFNGNLDLSSIWMKFLGYWRDSNSQYSLQVIVHWYNQVNSQSLYAEDAIVLAQNAFELLFEWLTKIRSNKIIVFGPQKATSEKVSRMLEICKVSSEVPKALSELAGLDVKYNNGPYRLSEIRNSFVHPTQPYRTFQTKFTPYILAEAVQLSLWYIELFILFSLDYEGNYYNRCLGTGVNNVPMPWVSQ
jgi:hypothetical protein